MSHGIYTSLAAGVRSFESLDLVSNNLANSDTPGYRAQRAVFRVVAPDEAASSTGAPARIAERYLLLDEVANDLTRGGVKETGEDAHLALDGEGFFVLQGEGGSRYTRDGTLRVDLQGRLVHQSGAPLLSDADQPIVLQPGSFDVTADGGVAQRGEEIGRIKVVKFDDPSKLTREGSNLFVGGGAQTQPAMETRVIQGSLELSNVQPLKELVELIRLNRFHQAYQKTLESIDEANRQLNTRVGRLTAN